jgi:hypothetical protein
MKEAIDPLRSANSQEVVLWPKANIVAEAESTAAGAQTFEPGRKR